jgi:hypothetical protein
MKKQNAKAINDYIKFIKKNPADFGEAILRGDRMINVVRINAPQVIDVICKLEKMGYIGEIAAYGFKYKIDNAV